MKKKTKKQLWNLAWKKFSIWIRSSEADFQGYVACCCCGRKFQWNSGEIHAGHWIHGRLEFDERNIHPQCRGCNYKYNPNSKVDYAIYMAKRYGEKEMVSIRGDSITKGNNYSRLELEEIIEKYNKLLKKLWMKQRQ